MNLDFFGDRSARLLRTIVLVSSLLSTSVYLPASVHATDAPATHKEFQPGQVWTDTSGAPINAHGGGILFHEGTYYWYGEIKSGKTWLPDCNKSWGGTRVVTTGVSCYSSKDLYNWKFEGNVLPAVTDDPKHELYKSKVLERPKVIYNAATRKFVLWMHIDSENYALAHAGVAVSDSPTGPFTYQGSFRPNDAMSRDMTVFVDDDAQAYLFSASEENATMHITLLSQDYQKPTGRFERVFVGRSMEAPTVFKHDHRYYVIASGCTAWDPNAARSAVANTIWGPYQELGNPCAGPDKDLTFHGQSTCVLPVSGKPGAFIFMADRWNKHDLADSRYLWLPIEFQTNGLAVRWRDRWDLSAFNK
jgi:beta-xylosidase